MHTLGIIIGVIAFIGLMILRHRAEKIVRRIRFWDGKKKEKK